MFTSPLGQRRFRRAAASAAALLIGASMLAACGGGAGAGDDDETVALSGVNGDPTNGPSGAPFGAIQIAEGWDEQDGYTLKWDVAQSATAGMQLMAAGSVDIAQGATPNGYAAAHLDDSIRVIGFLNGPNYLLTVPEDSDIVEPEDLAGKTIGVMTLGSSSHLMAQGAVKAAGLDSEDVTYLPVAIGAPMAEALNSGKIDVLVGWEGMWQSISAIADTPLKRLDTRLTELYGQMLLTTTTDAIENKREALVAYLRNFYRGCALAADDPERAVEDHWDVFGNVAPPAAEREERVVEYAEWNQDFYKTCIEPSPSTGTIGSLSQDELEETYQFFLDNGIVEDPIELDTVVDLSLVEEAMDGFDVSDYDN